MTKLSPWLPYLYCGQSSLQCLQWHDDVIKWKHFLRYWPFVRGIHRSPVNSPHKGQWRGALMFSLICTWTNASVNNRDASDSRRHRTHYDIAVMDDITVTLMTFLFQYPKIILILVQYFIHYVMFTPYNTSVGHCDGYIVHSDGPPLLHLGRNHSNICSRIAAIRSRELDTQISVKLTAFCFSCSKVTILNVHTGHEN